MKRVVETIGVSRSRLAERSSAESKPRSPRYSKADDAELLPLIRDIIDERLTYGYRRVCAVLNRRLEALGGPGVNHKRVYRIMRLHGMLLARHSGKRPKRAHEGKVVVIRSNIRRCSDAFELSCANGESVRVAFALDCCDREVVSWTASTRGISGEMIRDLMLDCVERRFRANRAPHSVQWLSDNGSCYTARETVEFAVWLGLESCFTSVLSPESNGMAKSFVKTFKRDYAYVHERLDARTLYAQLADWVEDYNERHPHKGLRMQSPREFIRSLATAECPV